VYISNKKQARKEWEVVKRNLLSAAIPLTCDIKYHEWVNTYRSLILPNQVEEGYAYDIHLNPQKYIPFMIAMNIELEKIGIKMFQFCPLQTSLKPLHITIDTTALGYLMFDEHVKDELGHLTSEKKHMIWSKFFHFPRKCRIKGYVFDYLIQTDGYVVALQFLNEKYVEAVQTSKSKQTQARALARTLTLEEKLKRKQEKAVLVNKPKPSLVKQKKPDEFHYFEDVDPKLLEGKHLFIDPGKRSLFTIMDDDGKFFSYSNGIRLRQTKRLKYQQRLQDYRDKNGITEIEKELSVHNTKTCDVDKFKAYIQTRSKLRTQLALKYEDVKFRQYRWYSYMNTRRSEETMLNQIENTYSKDHTIILGDWSIGKQMRNFISTPNIGLRRKLATRFNVYLIDEYRTSCLNWKTEQYNDNLYLPDKTGTDRKMHSILTYEMENKRQGCINRDRNSCHNMRKLFENHITYGVRPERYRRGFEIKCSNPDIGLSNTASNAGNA
jgi:hypothetical protein